METELNFETCNNTLRCRVWPQGGVIPKIRDPGQGSGHGQPHILRMSQSLGFYPFRA